MNYYFFLYACFFPETKTKIPKYKYITTEEDEIYMRENSL